MTLAAGAGPRQKVASPAGASVDPYLVPICPSDTHLSVNPNILSTGIFNKFQFWQCDWEAGDWFLETTACMRVAFQI